MYTMYWRHGSTEYDTEYDFEHYSQHYSGHYSKIPNERAICPMYNAEYDPESDPDSALLNPSYINNADTAHHEALQD